MRFLKLLVLSGLFVGGLGFVAFHFLNPFIVKGQPNLPVLTEQERLETRNAVLELQNFEFKLKPLLEQRQTLANAASQKIEALYSKYKLSEEEVGFNVDTLQFLRYTDEQKKQILEAKKKQDKKQ